MPYVSPDALTRAREMDLLTYLERYEPDELVQLGGSTYTTRTHDSLKISNGKWYWWSRGIGGKTALDYLVTVRGVSLPDAVSAVTGAAVTQHSREGTVQYSAHSTPQHKIPFQLPSKHADCRRAFVYLRSRGIDPEIINHCIKHGQLYEDAVHHNCVFVGFEGSTPKYGALRSTLSDSVFAGEVPGSDKHFSFAVPRQAGENGTLCVFESAIDALSYLSILKLRGHDWRRANCLSLGGVCPPRKNGESMFPLALGQYLKDNPNIETVVLCLDSDTPGRSAAAAIKTQLSAYAVIDNPPRDGKDYNDLLQKLTGAEGRNRTRGEAR